MQKIQHCSSKWKVRTFSGTVSVAFLWNDTRDCGDLVDIARSLANSRTQKGPLNDQRQ